MITTALSALNGIGGGLGQALSARTTGAAPASSQAASPESFGQALAAKASEAIGTLQSAESASVQALQGKADTRELVDAVMSAEQSLQAAIAIRDKIVSSYLEISRMQI